MSNPLQLIIVFHVNADSGPLSQEEVEGKTVRIREQLDVENEVRRVGFAGWRAPEQGRECHDWQGVGLNFMATRCNLSRGKAKCIDDASLWLHPIWVLSSA